MYKKHWQTDKISTWNPSPVTSQDFGFWWGFQFIKVIRNVIFYDCTSECCCIHSKVVVLYLGVVYKLFCPITISLSSLHRLALNYSALKTWENKHICNVKFNIMAPSFQWSKADPGTLLHVKWSSFLKNL